MGDTPETPASETGQAPPAPVEDKPAAPVAATGQVKEEPAEPKVPSTPEEYKEMWKGFTQSRQEIASLKQELTEFKSRVPVPTTPANEDDDLPEDVRSMGEEDKQRYRTTIARWIGFEAEKRIKPILQKLEADDVHLVEERLRQKYPYLDKHKDKIANILGNPRSLSKEQLYEILLHGVAGEDLKKQGAEEARITSKQKEASASLAKGSSVTGADTAPTKLASFKEVWADAKRKVSGRAAG